MTFAAITYFIIISMSPWIQSNVLQDRQAEWWVGVCDRKLGRAAPVAAFAGLFGVLVLTPAFLTWRAGEVIVAVTEEVIRASKNRYDRKP